jgi:hypothetical protein
MNEFAILALANCFEMIDAFTDTKPGKDRIFFMQPVLRNDDRDGIANGFLCSVTKKP